MAGILAAVQVVPATDHWMMEDLYLVVAALLMAEVLPMIGTLLMLGIPLLIGFPLVVQTLVMPLIVYLTLLVMIVLPLVVVVTLLVVAEIPLVVGALLPVGHRAMMKGLQTVATYPLVIDVLMGGDISLVAVTPSMLLTMSGE